MNRIHHPRCPVCASSHINPLFRVKDHAISKEYFEIWLCSECTLRFTQDAPDAHNMPPYYNSPDYISHSNADKGLFNKAYQSVRKYTMKQKADLVIRETVREGRLLDVGAGVGAFLQTMQARGWQVTGTEPAEAARQKARTVFGLHLQEPDHLYTLQNDSFDAITLWHVLEHVHDLHGYMRKFSQLLKPQGKLFVAVPNYGSLDADIYKSYWAAYDVPRHLYHFTPRSIRKLAAEHHLQINAMQPMWFDSFYISLLSSKYRKSSFGTFTAVWNGIRSNVNALLHREEASSLIYVMGKKS